MAIVRAVTGIEMGLGAAALIVAVGAILLSAFGPPGFHGMSYQGPPSGGELPLLGVIGVAFGCAWMRRIRYADPEAGPSNWRSH
jgi:hypothetical protein